MGESTVYRHLDTVALIIGPEDEIVAQCRTVMDKVQIRIVRVGHVAAACERLPVVMPHVVIAIGEIQPSARETLLDRTTAVGATVFEIDPAMPADKLSAIIDRAALVAMERASVRDSPLTVPEPREPGQ
jgi:hypothetical protein